MQGGDTFFENFAVDENMYKQNLETGAYSGGYIWMLKHLNENFLQFAKNFWEENPKTLSKFCPLPILDLLK